MKMEIAKNFFLWCTIIDYGILLLWCVLYKAVHSTHYRLTSWWFPVTEEEYDKLNLRGIAVFKMAIIIFNLVPYIALRIAS
jgi:hypothetical protein